MRKREALTGHTSTVVGTAPYQPNLASSRTTTILLQFMKDKNNHNKTGMGNHCQTSTTRSHHQRNNCVGY